MLYSVSYRSMTAIYGPDVIEAKDAQEAKSKMARALGTNQLMCIEAEEISLDQAARILAKKK